MRHHFTISLEAPDRPEAFRLLGQILASAHGRRGQCDDVGIILGTWADRELARRQLLPKEPHPDHEGDLHVP
jgi:hypothetical protein